MPLGVLLDVRWSACGVGITQVCTDSSVFICLQICTVFTRDSLPFPRSPTLIGTPKIFNSSPSRHSYNCELVCVRAKSLDAKVNASADSRSSWYMSSRSMYMGERTRMKRTNVAGGCVQNGYRAPVQQQQSSHVPIVQDRALCRDALTSLALQRFCFAEENSMHVHEPQPRRWRRGVWAKTPGCFCSCRPFRSTCARWRPHVE